MLRPCGVPTPARPSSTTLPLPLRETAGVRSNRVESVTRVSQNPRSDICGTSPNYTRRFPLTFPRREEGATAKELPGVTNCYLVLRHVTVFPIWQNEPTAARRPQSTGPASATGVFGGSLRRSIFTAARVTPRYRVLPGVTPCNRFRVSAKRTQTAPTRRQVVNRPAVRYHSRPGIARDARRADVFQM